MFCGRQKNNAYIYLALAFFDLKERVESGGKSGMICIICLVIIREGAAPIKTFNNSHLVFAADDVAALQPINVFL